MPRYYMHLVDSIDILLDPEGIEAPFETIPGKALASARDCIAGDVRDGRVDLRYRIDVHDEMGRIVHRLPFADVIEVIGSPGLRQSVFVSAKGAG